MRARQGGAAGRNRFSGCGRSVGARRAPAQKIDRKEGKDPGRRRSLRKRRADVPRNGCEPWHRGVFPRRMLPPQDEAGPFYRAGQGSRAGFPPGAPKTDGKGYVRVIARRQLEWEWSLERTPWR